MAFAGALIRGDFQVAYEMLAAAGRAAYTPDSLEEQYSEMISYFTAPAEMFDELHIDTASPMMGSSDFGWAYVSIIDKDGDIEAVSFFVCNEDGNIRIRELEWGRP